MLILYDSSVSCVSQCRTTSKHREHTHTRTPMKTWHIFESDKGEVEGGREAGVVPCGRAPLGGVDRTTLLWRPALMRPEDQPRLRSFETQTPHSYATWG
jgi:hypothetical protein